MNQESNYFMKGQDLMMFHEEPSHSLPYIEQSAFINLDDDLLGH